MARPLEGLPWRLEVTTEQTTTIGKGIIRRVYEQTALDDHDVLLDAGTYPIRFVTIDYHDVAPEKAYYVTAKIPATRVTDGVRFGKAGDRVTYHLSMYAYEWRDGRRV